MKFFNILQNHRAFMPFKMLYVKNSASHQNHQQMLQFAFIIEIHNALKI